MTLGHHPGQQNQEPGQTSLKVMGLGAQPGARRQPEEEVKAEVKRNRQSHRRDGLEPPRGLDDTTVAIGSG